MITLKKLSTTTQPMFQKLISISITTKLSGIQSSTTTSSVNETQTITSSDKETKTMIVISSPKTKQPTLLRFKTI